MEVHLGILMALFVGVFFEGEVILLSAVIAAHHDHVPLVPILVTAFCATVCSDILYFSLGRSRGAEWLTNRKYLKPKIEKARTFLNKNQIVILFTYRFMYGMRTIIPLIVGINKLPWPRFLFFSLFGSAVWVIVLAILGSIFGEAIIQFLSHLQDVEFYVIGVLAVVGIVLGIRKFRNHHAVAE